MRSTSLGMGTYGEEPYYATTCSAVGGSGDLETELSQPIASLMKVV